MRERRSARHPRNPREKNEGDRRLQVQAAVPAGMVKARPRHRSVHGDPPAAHPRVVRSGFQPGFELRCRLARYRSVPQNDHVLVEGHRALLETMISQDEPAPRGSTPNSSAFDTVADKAMIDTMRGQV